MYINLRELLGPSECGGRHDRYFEETRLDGVRSSRDIFEDSYYNPDMEPVFDDYTDYEVDRDYMYYFGDDEITYSSKLYN